MSCHKATTKGDDVYDFSNGEEASQNMSKQDAYVFESDGFGRSFSDKVIRMQFVRKVYTIIFSQLVITTGIVAIFIFTPAIRNFYCPRVFHDDNGYHCDSSSRNGCILYIVSYAIFFVTYSVIICFERVRKRFPLNMLVLLIFTLALSVMTASIAIFNDVQWVMMSMGLTAVIVLGLTLFSFHTKVDFTGSGCTVYLLTAAWLFVIFAFASIFLCLRGYHWTYLAYCCLLSTLFSVFLIYETQMIIGGRKHSISAEDHVSAALQIYVDIVYIFLGFLGCGGSGCRS